MSLSRVKVSFISHISDGSHQTLIVPNYIITVQSYCFLIAVPTGGQTLSFSWTLGDALRYVKHLKASKYRPFSDRTELPPNL